MKPAMTDKEVDELRNLIQIILADEGYGLLSNEELNQLHDQFVQRNAENAYDRAKSISYDPQ